MEPLKTPEVKASKPASKKYIANVAIYHEGKDYQPGDEIEVFESLAKIWLENGTIEEIY
jgi:hypothetical protein